MDVFQPITRINLDKDHLMNKKSFADRTTHVDSSNRD
jgi:hypothetical protein